MISSIPLNTSNLYTIIWFQVFQPKTNNLYTIMFSSNNSYIIIIIIIIITTICLYRFIWFLILLSNINMAQLAGAVEYPDGISAEW